MHPWQGSPDVLTGVGVMIRPGVPQAHLANSEPVTRTSRAASPSPSCPFCLCGARQHVLQKPVMPIVVGSSTSTSPASHRSIPDLLLAGGARQQQALRVLATPALLLLWGRFVHHAKLGLNMKAVPSIVVQRRESDTSAYLVGVLIRAPQLSSCGGDDVAAA